MTTAITPRVTAVLWPVPRRFAGRLLFCASTALVTLLCTFPATAQDRVTVGTVTATSATVDVPVYIRDTAGTPLGVDQPAGSKIQAFSIKVNYAPQSAVQSVTFSRAGITPQNHIFEQSPSGPGTVSLLEQCPESTSPFPFTLNAAAPGDQVAHLLFTLAQPVTPGATITLTLDSSLTNLTDQGGSAATKETVGNGGLALVNGAINVAPISITLTPSSKSIGAGSNSSLTASSNWTVPASTILTLTSSNPAVATVPASVTIGAGLRNASFSVSALKAGSTTVTATLPPANGGGSSSSSINVFTPCGILDPPLLTGPDSSEAGTSYTVRWNAVAGATDYFIDESTDATFSSAVTTTPTTATSATFTHASGSYSYQVRAHGIVGSCNLTSLSSNVITVAVTFTPPPLINVIPVAGSLGGGFGSFFRTTVQLYNPTGAAVTGRIVFHPQGASAAAGDPSIHYDIAARKTVTFADLLPAMGLGDGLGTADLIGDVGSPLPQVAVRVFNDGGSSGTTGLTTGALRVEDALAQGTVAAILTTANAARFRLNVGVRTMDEGATLAVTVIDPTGNVVKTVTKTYPPLYFEQVSSSTFLDGFVLGGGETISMEVISGRAFVYGATTDNVTNDPSIQFARPAP